MDDAMYCQKYEIWRIYFLWSLRMQWSHNTQAHSVVLYCWAISWECLCLCMHIKVHSDWLLSNIKIMWLFLETFRMDGYLSHNIREPSEVFFFLSLPNSVLLVQPFYCIASFTMTMKDGFILRIQNKENWGKI